MKAIILAVVTVSGVAMAQGKDLRGLYLYGAQLKNVDLRGADLDTTQLGHADLTGADLRGAKMVGAYLYKANLAGADLRGAVFSKKLNGAELTRVNLTGAKFDEKTVLPFAEAEALRRGMVKVETVELPAELPASREATSAKENQMI